MIGMPVGQQYLGYAQLVFVKIVDQSGEPDWTSLPTWFSCLVSKYETGMFKIAYLSCIYQNPFLATADKIRIGSLQLHVARVSAKYSYHLRAEFRDSWEIWQSSISSG